MSVFHPLGTIGRTGRVLQAEAASTAARVLSPASVRDLCPGGRHFPYRSPRLFPPGKRTGSRARLPRCGLAGGSGWSAGGQEPLARRPPSGPTPLTHPRQLVGRSVPGWRPLDPPARPQQLLEDRLADGMLGDVVVDCDTRCLLNKPPQTVSNVRSCPDEYFHC